MNTRLVRLGAALAGALLSTSAYAERIFVLTDEFTFGTRIQTFDSNTPGVIASTGQITGLVRGDRLTGLDLRPADMKLYSVSKAGRVYRIDKNASGLDYTAVSLGMISGATVSGSRFGIDFNPTVDRLRLVSDANQNLRINLNSSPPAAINDGMATLFASSDVDLIGAAYTNSRPGVTSTMLFGIDAITSSLVRATNANLGTYVATNAAGMNFGPLGLTLAPNSRLSFDISGGSGNAFLTLGDAFYRLSLETGAATLVGATGPRDVIGMTAGAVPEPASWAMMIGGFGMVGASMRRRKAQTRVVAG